MESPKLTRSVWASKLSVFSTKYKSEKEERLSERKRRTKGEEEEETFLLNICTKDKMNVCLSVTDTESLKDVEGGTHISICRPDKSAA